jgi:dipeptidyl aminopeptidase/acylaminoacyl peptidase
MTLSLDGKEKTAMRQRTTKGERHNRRLARSRISARVIAIALALALAAYVTFVPRAYASGGMGTDDLLGMKWCNGAAISPDGRHIAYTVRVPREADDKPGSPYSQLYVASVGTGDLRPFITGKVNVSSLQWSPDGSRIAFLSDRGKDEKTQVWMISVAGGEAVQVTESKSGVSFFRWHPGGKKIAYVATVPETDREKKLKEKGYDFIYYEEDLKDRNLYMLDVYATGGIGEPEQLTEGVAVWDCEFSPDGGTIAASVSSKNLVDYSYMFQKIYLLDVKSKTLTQLTDNPGKLGNYAFSPDGSKLAYAAALERKDEAVSQAYVIDAAGGKAVNLTPPKFRGHIEWVGWKDKNTVLYLAGEGVWPTLSLVNVAGGKREIILNSQDTGLVFEAPSYTKDFKQFALICEAPDMLGELYYWKGGDTLKRMTTLNPWLAKRKLGKQEVIRYQARDGLEIEGLLIYPVDYVKGQRYPLIVVVHGGPEAHYSNGWLTYYSRPGQVLADKGYAVFYPNYRASTGYGVDFAYWGYGDPAGKEFDDLADGIDHLVEMGIADRDRVGLGGGSYGGYAAAWFGSYYTEYVKAVCMFVGISDLISKRGTTDIPYEELYVHSGKKLEDMWDLSLKRSPIYWAHKSKTAVLILGGTSDTRVHPSQSLEFYRRLKMNDHPAVRLVQYPGERHGNSKQPGRIDVLYRTLQWYDWYVKDLNPLDGPMPPLDIGDSYGLDLED